MQHKRYNILIIPCTEWLKGSQQRLHHLSKEWSKRHKVYVFYLERQDDISYEISFSERLEYSNMLRIPTLKTKNYTFFLVVNFFLELIFLPKIIKKAQINVIVAEGLGPSNAASIVSKIFKKRFIFDYSDSYSAFVSSYISNFTIKKIFEYFAVLMTNINIKLSNATVVVSDGLLSNNRGEELKQYKIVNGVSEDYFPLSQDLESTDGTIIITFMGAIESWVNFEDIMAAISALNKENKAKFILKIVGDGLKLKELKERTRQKGLNQSVIFTGWVPYGKLHEYIKNSNICILPFDNSSISSLSMPVKIHEYAISKKPIITTPLPEIKKIYGSSVMYATTQEEYIHVIKLLLKDKELKLRLIEEAYLIAKNYSWELLAQRFERLFDN